VTRSRDNMRIYDGVEMHGRVVTTVVRGVPVLREGSLAGRPGHGRFVRPSSCRGAPSSAW
jgi:N-acyl-D-aspartate/D-glutamate deacylase